MTKKDFELIAEVLASFAPSKAERDVVACGVAHDAICKVFADKLAHTNPQFNRARFMKACNPFDELEYRK